MALKQSLSIEDAPTPDAAAPAEDGRLSFDVWQHTTMLDTDDTADPPEENVIRGVD
jgi:hypothetical protein